MSGPEEEGTGGVEVGVVRHGLESGRLLVKLCLDKTFHS